MPLLIYRELFSKAFATFSSRDISVEGIASVSIVASAATAN